MKEVRITDIKGVTVGHAQNLEGGSGCTAILFDHACLASADVRGGGPASKETELLKPECANQGVDAIMLNGGSAFGLDACSGAMKFLEERGRGVAIAGGVVPIVPGASIFDLPFGDWNCRPDPAMGYQACLNAKGGEVAEGCVGAGTGATVGKYFGPGHIMKSGLGTYALQVGNIIVGAIVSVNAVGDVYDIDTNQVIAGAFETRPGDWVGPKKYFERFLCPPPVAGANTTIGCVVTNAKMDKAMLHKMSSVAHNGYARAIRPVHTLGDGDTIFAVTTAEYEADLNAVHALGAEVMARAIMRAAWAANSMFGLPCAKDSR